MLRVSTQPANPNPSAGKPSAHPTNPAGASLAANRLAWSNTLAGIGVLRYPARTRRPEAVVTSVGGGCSTPSMNRLASGRASRNVLP